MTELCLGRSQIHRGIMMRQEVLPRFVSKNLAAARHLAIEAECTADAWKDNFVKPRVLQIAVL